MLQSLNGYKKIERYHLRHLLTLIMLSCSLAGCRQSGKPIVIVLRDGYEGEFQIIKDGKRGKDLVERDGSWVFEIPPEGTLYLKNDSPFYRWHTATIRYRNGQLVEYEDLGTRAGERQIRPGQSEASTDFDGTTHTWKVLGPKPNKQDE
jgi:hypothetical protein